MNIIKSTFFKAILSLSFGGFFLYLVLKNTSWSETKDVFARGNLEWCLIALIFYACVIACRSLRWQLLLNQSKRLAYTSVLKSLIVGSSINNILPARLGELFRADYVKRNYQLNRSQVLGSIAVERLLDGLVVITALVIGILGLEKIAYNSLIIPLCITAAIVFGGTTFVFVFLGGKQQLTFLKKYPLIQSKIHQFTEAISILRHRSILPVALLSVFIWILEIIGIACIMNYAGISLTILQLLLAIGVISLATLLPSPPGYLGTLQYAYVLVIVPFGFDSAQGVVAATANQIFMMGILTLMGLGILAFDFIDRYKISYLFSRSSKRKEYGK